MNVPSTNLLLGLGLGLVTSNGRNTDFQAGGEGVVTIDA